MAVPVMFAKLVNYSESSKHLSVKCKVSVSARVCDKSASIFFSTSGSASYFILTEAAQAFLVRKVFPVFAITAITKISNRLNICKLRSNVLVIVQVMAVIAKCLSAQKITPKHPDLHLRAVNSRICAHHLQHHCDSSAAVLHIIRSTAAKPSQ